MANKQRREFLPFGMPLLGKEEEQEVLSTLRSGWLSTGPRTMQFEKEVSEFVGVKHAIGLTSCTAALHLALLAHGIGKGDEVILPSFTFAATVNMVVNVGAKPVFADIRKDIFTIDPVDVKKKITSRTKAIIPVHYAGQSADMDQLASLAKSNKITIIEDAAHALGACYKGKQIGSFGNTTCFSFYATKNLTTGEGGMLVTDNDKIADYVRKNRLHGISRDAWKRYAKGGSWRYQVESPGWKYNMFDLQAALGICQLKRLPGFLRQRERQARLYDKLFQGETDIRLPITALQRSHAWHLYPISVKAGKRDTLIEELAKRNIGTSVHFIPLHLQPFYKKQFGTRCGDLPVTEQVFEEIMSLPLYPKMTDADTRYVAASVKDILRNF